MDHFEQTSIDGFVNLTKAMLQELQEALSDQWLGGTFPHTISDQFASQVIRACFYASMTIDEGKWPRVILQACALDDSFERIASFNPPLAFDVSSISKLAHSVDDWCSLGFSELNGVPVIVGILPSVSVLLGTFVTQRAMSLSSLKVAIRCPGNIDVICERGILSFKAGVVTQYQSILSSKALERLATIMDNQVNRLLKRDVDAESLEVAAKSDEIEFHDNADSKSQLVISELVWRISEIGIGGILIVTNQPEHDTLFYKYRTHAGSLQNAVVRYWQAAHQGRSGPASATSSQLHPNSTLVHEGVKLKECVAATAQFAGTDGAIVLGTDFSLQGFGALIGKIAIDESKVKFIDGKGNLVQYSNIVRNKGARHQAALSFAMREEGVVVFVVSQDGHVTVIENQDGVVRVETGLRADGV